VPERFARIGDPSEGIDEAAGSLEPLLELAAQHEEAGFADAPWPPHFDKAADEPRRVQPSKRRGSAPAREGLVPPPAPGKVSGPTGRRRTTVPLIEVARAATKAEAMDGLERWKARHPDVWPHLAEADVLVDSMRGRSSLWYRVRLNLRSVPDDLRPPQEALEVDYDPWEGWDGTPPGDAHQRRS
jgi:bifunctional non-homologous end joining protein LigD